MRKIVYGVMGIVAVMAIAAAVWEPLNAQAGVAPPQRSYDVEIVRDEFGVPHINGKNDADAAYGLAYAHSEDDFATIEEVIAMTRGRFGALTGQDGAKVDYVLHLLGARETAHKRYKELSPEVRAVVEGYAAGVNHYAAKHPGEVRLSKMFPVSGEDVVTGFVLRAPFFYGLDNVIGALSEGKNPPPESALPMTPAGRDPQQNGSNGFALAPKKMADGQTWLVSNSHQPYEGSVAWYEAVMHSGEGLDMAGATFPGAPFILLGHNRNLGWTNTVNRPDLIDVYKLEMDKGGDKYRYDGKWLPLQKERVWLPVKFGPFALPIPQTVHRSVHGPVIINDRGAFAVRYAGIDNAKAVEQYYRNMKAANWDEWSKSMSIGGITATNFIYADKSGRIALIYNALFPDRKAGFDYTKVLPGNTSAAVWAGPVGFDRIPKVVDPASGFVHNENNTPFLGAGNGSEMNPAEWSPLLGIETNMTNRAIRADELLSADPLLTREELLRIKFDKAYSKRSFAGDWMATLQATKVKEADLVAAQKLLASWDWSSDGKGAADAFAERILRIAMIARWRHQPLPPAQEALREAVDDMKARFGRIDPPLAEVQRLERGKVSLPMFGGTDTLRATSRWDKDAPSRKGRVMHGDSFIMLVRWDQSGKVVSESIQPYGAATNRPNSAHYTDQMKLFVAEKFKPVHFEWADAVKHAKKRYRP
jgi:acyl-homoserine-lactone acylase